MRFKNSKVVLYALLILFSAGVLFPLPVFGSEALSAGTIKIGVLEEPKTLNIWSATDAWSNRVLSQIYQPLFVLDPKTLDSIPWLAEKAPEYDPTTISYTVTLRDARWSDGTPFTAEDVAFTGNLIKEFKVPKNYSLWKFVQKIDVLDQRTVRFTLSGPEAVFLSRTLFTPIVQKKQWESAAGAARKSSSPLSSLFRVKMNPIGTGPFVLKEWREGVYVYLEKNPHFFGRGEKIAGLLLGPYVDGIILRVYGTTDAAVMAIRKGDMDMFWWGIQPGYVEDLSKDPDTRIFSSEKSAMYYIGFNVRKEPFSDVAFRRAVATLIDKDFIIKRVLQGYALEMHTFVPPGNTFWHLNAVPAYDKHRSRAERIREAQKILKDAGYTWRVDPEFRKSGVVGAEGIVLPNGNPMKRLTILTPPADYDPLRAMIGILAQEWLRKLGIPVTARPMAFGAMIDQVKVRRDFDLFVLGFGHLSLDPDYLRSFFYSANDKPRGWNTSGYHNPQFDRLADQSAREMDPQKRRETILEMQRILIHDIPFLPLYDPKLIEAVRTDHFGGWVQMLGGIGNTWSFCTIKQQ